MSDAMESIVNVATAVAALIAIRMPPRPADHDHPTAIWAVKAVTVLHAPCSGG